MNAVLPSLVPPLEQLGQALILFLTGKYIEQAATPAAQLAKAQVLLSLTTAVIEVNSGNPAGVTDLQTALQALIKSVQDPAGALALNALLATLDTELATLANTFIGKVGGMTANVILTQVQTAAQYYVTTLTPTVPAADLEAAVAAQNAAAAAGH